MVESLPRFSDSFHIGEDRQTVVGKVILVYIKKIPYQR